MAQHIKQGTYYTVSQAVDVIGCTDGWIRMLIRTGKLPAVSAGGRAYLIAESDALAARDSLTTRANAKRHLAVRPLADRKRTARKPRRKPARKG